MNNFKLIKCPFCNAKGIKEKTCKRCGNDLSNFAELLKKAEFHLQQAVFFEKNKNFKKALFHSGRSLSLKFSNEALNIYNKSLVKEKRFEEVLQLKSPEP
ncbi:MAG: hypothetical protein ACQEQS_08815 [Thermodesulfobacteriota bacterium]